ncbi:MAG TPA: alpha/beta fold hydrolase [Actinomycetota bacterium]|nr:alpha/beta fold hydrolase [Actinomycetota bacterium]
MTLLLLHSAGATTALWDRVLEHLDGIPAFAWPLPGRAGAAWPDNERERDVAAYARAIMARMDGEGIERATIAGHSLGGAVALQMALAHSDRVAGLGLSCTGARLRVLPHVLEGFADGVRDVIDFWINVQCGPATGDRERIVMRRMLESAGMEQTWCDLRACDGFDVMDRLPEIGVRTQVFGGGHDVVTPPKYARYLAERISGARLTIFPGAGHTAPLEHPEEMAGDLAVLWAATAPPVDASGRRRPSSALRPPATGRSDRSGC